MFVSCKEGTNKSHHSPSQWLQWDRKCDILLSPLLWFR